MFMRKIKEILKRVYRYLRYGIPSYNKVYANIQTVTPEKLLEGRTAIITGGTSGIGKTIALTYLKAGANVIITGRTQNKIEDAINSLKENVQEDKFIYGVPMDLTSVKSITSAFEQIKKLVGSSNIDILVNNAGVNGGGFLSCTEEEYDNVLNTNLKGPFFLTQAFTKYLIDNKIKGNILNIVSSSGIRPAYNSYTISKWGLRGFTEGIARMLAPYNIVVNGIAPGPTATPMQGKHTDEDEITHPANLTGRMAISQEIADMALMLISDRCRTIIGDIVYMSGGGGNVTNEDISYNLQ